jgi:hypothetical protein
MINIQQNYVSYAHIPHKLSFFIQICINYPDHVSLSVPAEPHHPPLSSHANYWPKSDQVSLSNQEIEGFHDTNWVKIKNFVQ